MNIKKHGFYFAIAVLLLIFLLKGINFIQKTGDATDVAATPQSGDANDIKENSWPAPSEDTDFTEYSSLAIWEYPAVSRNAQIYVTTENLLYIVAENEICAVEKGSGSAIWSYHCDSGSIVWASDSVAVIRDDDRLWGFDIREGRSLWSVTYEKNRRCFALGEYIALIDSTPNYTAALIKPENGDELCSIPTGSNPSGFSIVGDIAVVSSAEVLTAYSLESGTAIWSLNYEIPGPRALSILEESVILGDGTTLQALEIGDGSSRWKLRLPERVISVHPVGTTLKVTIADGTSLVVERATAELLSADAATCLLIAAQDGALIYSAIYSGPEQGKSIALFARNKATGDVMWRWTTASKGEEQALPRYFVADDYVAVTHASYIGAVPDPASSSYSTEVSFISTDTGRLVSRASYPEGMRIVDFGRDAAYLLTIEGVLKALPIITSGGVAGEGERSSTQESSQEVRGKLLIRTDPSNARIYINGVNKGRGPELRFAPAFGFHEISVELAGYQTAGRQIQINSVDLVSVQFTPSPSIEQLWDVPVSADAAFLYVTPSALVFSTRESLGCYDQETGVLLWESDHPVTAEPAVAVDTAYWGSDNRVRAARLQSGETLWELTCESGVRWVGIRGDTVVASDADGSVYGIASADGTLLWQRDDVIGMGTPYASDDALCFLGTDGRIRVVGSIDGRQRWSRRIGDSPDLLMTFGTSLYLYDSTSGELSAFDLSNGLPVGKPVRIVGTPVYNSDYLVYSRQLGMQNWEHSLLNVISSEGADIRPVLHKGQSESGASMFCLSDSVYIVESDKIHAYSLVSEDADWLAVIDGLNPSDPLFMEESSGVLFIGFDRTIMGFDRESGVLVWQSELGSRITDMAGSEHALYVSTSDLLFNIGTKKPSGAVLAMSTR